MTQKNPSGVNGLGNLYYNSNASIAVEYFKKAALNVNLGALNNLGICYEYGKGVNKFILKLYNIIKNLLIKIISFNG